MTLQLFEHLSQPIVLINPDGGIKYLNSAAKHLLNVTDYSEELNLVEVIENISLITIFLCILNKEPHMRIAVIWILAFYFSKERESQFALSNETA